MRTRYAGFVLTPVEAKEGRVAAGKTLARKAAAHGHGRKPKRKGGRY